MDGPGRRGALSRVPESLSELFPSETVLAPLAAAGKTEVLEQMVDVLVQVGRVAKSKKKDILAKLLEREHVGTTGIGRGFAIPHIRYDGVKAFVGAFAYAPDGVEFESLDGNPARAIFLVLSPRHLKQEHLQLMSRLTQLMSNDDFMSFLRSCETSQDYVDLVAELEPPA
jgi:mannitol/fructose-specific phosphotransferase system IIA component (Ntr-type)